MRSKRFLQDQRQLLDHAEEARTRAEAMTDADLKIRMLGIAEGYEKQAGREKTLAGVRVLQAGIRDAHACLVEFLLGCGRRRLDSARRHNPANLTTATARPIRSMSSPTSSSSSRRVVAFVSSASDKNCFPGGLSRSRPLLALSGHNLGVSERRLLTYSGHSCDRQLSRGVSNRLFLDRLLAHGFRARSCIRCAQLPNAARHDLELDDICSRCCATWPRNAGSYGLAVFEARARRSCG